MTLGTGERLGHYQILGPLGAGGVGEVHAALGDLDRAEELLRRGLEAHEPILTLGHPPTVYPELHGPQLAPLWQPAVRRRDGATAEE